MARVTKITKTKRKLSNRRKVIASAILGILFLIIPVLMIFIDPILIIAKYKLRLTKGSMIHDLLLSELESSRLAIYVFNITNGEDFLYGTDEKLKVQEVGPFVYQEYRTNENLDFDTEAEVIRFMPRTRPVFVPEESIGDPKDFVLNVPNIPLLSVAGLLSSYNFMVQQLFNMMVNQLGAKAIMKMDVHSYLWWYDDPIVFLLRKLLPGLVYYDGTGILERLYDEKADYTLEMAINNDDKFKVKSVKKSRHQKVWVNDTLVDRKVIFNDTYEGAAFPAGLTTETPINLYRQGICRTFGMQYSGEKQTKIGAKAFVYKFSNETFSNNNLCYSNGECPYGLLDISPCWFGLTIGLSQTHFLDADPKLLDQVDGLNPDREKHSSYILVDPKIGLTVDTSIAMQLNIVLGDVMYNYQARRFSDMVLPVAHTVITLPELPKQTKSSLTLMYLTGPQILLGLEIGCCIIGFLLSTYSIRLVYCHWLHNNNKRAGIMFNQPLRGKVSAELPLVEN